MARALLCAVLLVYLASSVASSSAPLSSVRIDATEVRSVTLDEAGSSVLVVVGPNDSMANGFRQEVRRYSLPDLKLTGQKKGFFDSYNVTGAFSTLVHGKAFVYNVRSFWSVQNSSLSTEFLDMVAFEGSDEEWLSAYDESTDAFYVVLRNRMGTDILKIQAKTGKIAGAVRLRWYEFVTELMVDTASKRLVLMGSADTATSSCYLFYIDLTRFRVSEGETLIGGESDWEGFASDIDVDRRNVYVVDASNTLYTASLDDFGKQKSLYCCTNAERVLSVRDNVYLLEESDAGDYVFLAIGKDTGKEVSKVRVAFPEVKNVQTVFEVIPVDSLSAFLVSFEDEGHNPHLGLIPF